MKQSILLSILVISAVILYTMPSALVNLGSSMLGKIIILVLAIASASCGKYYGLVAVILIVMLLESKYKEGQEGINDSDIDCEIMNEATAELETSDEDNLRDETSDAVEAADKAIDEASKALENAVSDSVTEPPNEGFLGNVVSKVKEMVISDGNELIEIERQFFGKNSNKEFSKLN